MPRTIQLPLKGTPKEEVLKKLGALRAQDASWKDGRTWSLVYYAGEEIASLLKEAYALFLHENGLSPLAFPSLRRFENEVVAMTAGLLGGDGEVAGNMTSGGTESILLAVKTARDMARKERGITAPEMVLPVTAHPAFEKAARYFNVKPVRIPVDSDFRADPEAARRAVTENTILMVGSAPAYPHGVIDPIEELAAVAREKNICFHVDACLGGFLLPFLRKLGHPVPDFDFRVPGVTSLSADVHKYGYAAKGASVILYRTRDIRKYQFTVVTDWQGGVYASPTMPGTRPGGAIAAAWAILNYLGEEGYLHLAEKVMKTTRALIEGINSITGLYVLGKPAMSVFAFTSDELNVYALGSAMQARGWHLDALQLPPCLHVMVTAAHENVVEEFLADLRDAVRETRESNQTEVPAGAAALYGMLGTITNRQMADELVLALLDDLYTLD